MTFITDSVGSLYAKDILGWFVACLVAWCITSAIRTWYRLRHIPGPRLASFSYVWVALNSFRGNNYKAYQDLRKYGSLVRNGPNYLVTDDPEALRRMAGNRNNYARDSWYRGARFSRDRETMASLIDTVEHDKIKAKLASGYSGRENPDLEAAVDSQVNRLVDLIRRKHISVGDDLKVVDFCPLSRYFTLDVISRLGYGKAFGYLDEGTDVYDWISQIDKLITVMSMALDVPWIRGLLFSSVGLGLFGPKPTDEKGVGQVMRVTRDLISARFDKGAEPQNDMFGGFIRRGVTRHELEGEALMQLFAGSDTSASSIRGTMLYTLATPQVYNRLKAEIKQAVERNEVSSPITQAQALKLPYLQAVIWEGYRMKCPVNYGHYKVVPPEGDTIDGLFIPGGTAIGHNTAALTRKESIFGRDVTVFRPERFLECSSEKRQEMDRALDITFGGGRWTCAGKSIALLELNKIFFELLRAFDFQLVNPSSPWKEKSFVLNNHRDMLMRITEAT